MKQVLLIDWENAGTFHIIKDEMSVDQDTLECIDQGTHDLIMAEGDKNGNIRYHQAQVSSEEDDDGETKWEIARWQEIK